MADSEQPSRKVTIRPAGWVVIALFVAGLGYAAWTFAWPWVQAQRPGFRPPVETPTERPAEQTPEPPPEKPEQVPAEPAPEPDSPQVPTPSPSPESPPDGTTLPRALFPARARALPPPGALPRLALPPLEGLSRPRSAYVRAPSEREALRMAARGEADYAVSTLAALAASPEVVDAGARVVWALGPSPNEARLFPDCRPDALADERLGVETGSAGHLTLLAAFADETLPALETYERLADLERAIQAGLITGGAQHGKEPPERAGDCEPIAAGVTTLLIVRAPGVTTNADAVSAIAHLALEKTPPETIVAFFDEARTTPGGFHDLYTGAQRVWQAVGLIPDGPPAPTAVERTLLEPLAEHAPTPAPSDAQSLPARGFGRPAWPDLH